MDASKIVPSSRAFDWTMALLSLLVAGGIVLDGWAHNHGLVDQSFFTPWHAVLYGSMAFSGIVYLVVGVANLRRGFPMRYALPYGYWLSAIGVASFILAGGLDLAWHTLFGIEADLDALVSPTHLALALSAALVFSGPIRSVAHQYQSDEGGWANIGPAILAIAASLILVGFFTQYAQPVGDESIVAAIAKSDDVTPTNELVRMRADGSDQRRLVHGLREDVWGAAISPNGKSIAYRVAAAGSAASDVYVANIDGSNARRITHSGRHDTQPAWSPDGKWIAYISLPAGTSGDFELDLVRPDGSGKRTVMSSVTTMQSPSWAPDGAHIAIGSRSGTTDEVAVVQTSDGSLAWLASTAGGSTPAWSPDGSTIAYTYTDAKSGATSIRTAPLSGRSSPAILAASGSSPAWSPDGAHIAFEATDAGTEQIFVADADGQNARDVTQLSGVDASHPAWSREGSIAFAQAGREPARASVYAQALALTSMIVQAIVVIGALLMLVRRWRTPLLALTATLVLFTSAIATQNDLYFGIIAGSIAGLVGDAIVWRRDAPARRFALYACGFAVPFVMTAVYLGLIASQQGIGWSPNFTFGSPIIAGIAGLLIAFAFDAPFE
jgi:Tol biopolymer transport system component